MVQATAPAVKVMIEEIGVIFPANQVEPFGFGRIPKLNNFKTKNHYESPLVLENP